MTVIMCITDDEYELPVAVTDNQRQMGECVGLSESGVSSAISRKNKLLGNRFGVPVRIVRVDIDEEDEDEQG